MQVTNQDVYGDDHTPMSIAIRSRNVEAIALLAAQYIPLDRVRSYLLLGAQFMQTLLREESRDEEEDIENARRAWLVAITELEAMRAAGGGGGKFVYRMDVDLHDFLRDYDYRVMTGNSNEENTGLPNGSHETMEDSTTMDNEGMDDPRYPPSLAPLAVYDYAAEVRTVADVRALTHRDGMRMHAMLVRERFLGAAHDKTLLCLEVG